MTDNPRRPRRLAALLMLDIVGFSRMMGQDDEETTSRVVDFHEGVAVLMSAHGGRVVDTSGDSVFAEFDSIVEALECAAEIQTRLAKDERDDRLMARIGVHFGDVLVHGDDLFGDGVNIAARLEQLCPPGGVAVSEAVHQEVASRYDFKDLGPRRLKNIDRSVRVFVIPPATFGYAGDFDPDDLELGEKIEAAREVAALVRERLRERKAAAEDDDEPDTGPRSVAGYLRSGSFWSQLTLGVLLVASRYTGWTSNAIYPTLGAVMAGNALGAIVAAATKRLGLRLFGTAVAFALSGALFFTGAVSRALMWVLAASTLGPAIAKMARRDPSR